MSQVLEPRGVNRPLAGRGAVPGPIVGPYMTLNMPCRRAVGNGETDTIVGAIQVPFDFRIEEIIVYYDNSATTSTLELSSNSTPAIDTNETALMSSGVSITATRDMTFHRPTGSAITLVEAARNLTQDTWIIAHCTTDGTGTLVMPLEIQIRGFPQGHIFADPAEDVPAGLSRTSGYGSFAAEHMGRGAMPGPVAGYYDVLTFCVDNETTGEPISTGLGHDVRILAMGWSVNAATGNPTFDLELWNKPSSMNSITQVTNATIDLGTDPAGFITGNTADSPTYLQNRSHLASDNAANVFNMETGNSSDDRYFLRVDHAAAGGTFSDLTVTVLVYVMGHIQYNVADD